MRENWPPKGYITTTEFPLEFFKIGEHRIKLIDAIKAGFHKLNGEITDKDIGELMGCFYEAIQIRESQTEEENLAHQKLIDDFLAGKSDPIKSLMQGLIEQELEFYDKLKKLYPPKTDKELSDIYLNILTAEKPVKTEQKINLINSLNLASPYPQSQFSDAGVSSSEETMFIMDNPPQPTNRFREPLGGTPHLALTSPMIPAGKKRPPTTASFRSHSPIDGDENTIIQLLESGKLQTDRDK